MFSPQSRLRHAVADTFAMVVYCSVVNMCIEVFLSGMSFEQSFYSRLVAIPVNILSSNIVVSMLMGAVYGYFLDYCRRLFKVSRYQQVKA